MNRCISPLSRTTFLTLLAAVLLAPTVQAAKPTEELLRLVPQDAALCLIVQDIRGNTRRLAESPFLAQLRKSPLGNLIPEEAAGVQLADLDKMLQTYLQTSVAELRDDIIGDSVVCAFWQGEGDLGERALMLTKARKPDLAASLLQRVQQAQLQSGELTKVEPLLHRGFKYTRCVERGGKTNYQLVHDGIIALAQEQPTMEHVIQVLADNPPGNVIAKQLNELGVLDAFGIFWINPRAFDGEMAKKLKSAEGNDAAFLKCFERYWKSTNALAVALRLEKDVDLSLHVRMSAAELPPAAARFLKYAGAPSRLWPLLPKDSLIAVTGRWNPADLFEMLSEFSPEESRKKALEDLKQNTQALLGFDLQKDLLPALGPDVGLYLAAPPSAQKDWFPDVVLAVRTQATKELPSPEETLTDALKTLGGLLALSRKNEGKPTVLKSELDGKTRIISLASDRDFPPGFQPAGAVKNGWLVLASSPAAIRRFGSTATGTAPTDGALVPLARISATNIASSYLKETERRQQLASTLAAAHQINVDEVQAKLTIVQAILELFETLELTQHSDGDQAALSLKLRTTAPLRKPN